MKVKDLDQETLYNFVNEYYENKTKVGELMAKYNIDDSSNFISRITLYDGDICEVCGGKIKYELSSRAYTKCLEDNPKVCENCGHTRDRKCYCEKCIEYREEQEKEEQLKKYAILKECFNRNKVSISTLKIEELLLLIFLNEKYEGDFGFIFKKEDFDESIYGKYLINILEHLYKKNVLKVNVDRINLNNFKIYDDKVHYNLKSLFLELNIEEDINNIDVRELFLSNFDNEDILDYWREICLNECMLYLNMRTITMNLGRIEDNLRSDIANLINDLLLSYCEGEILYMIYRYVNYASNFKIEYEVSDEKAHKAILTNITKCVNKQYEVKVFDRPYKLELNPIDELFYSKVLKMDLKESCRVRISRTILNDNDIDVEDTLKQHQQLIKDVKKFTQAGFSKEEIMGYLNISEDRYNGAIKYVDIDKGHL